MLSTILWLFCFVFYTGDLPENSDYCVLVSRLPEIDVGAASKRSCFFIHDIFHTLGNIFLKAKKQAFRPNPAR